jgi:hypothetical protein
MPARRRWVAVAGAGLAVLAGLPACSSRQSPTPGALVCPSIPPVPRATSGDLEREPLAPPALRDFRGGRLRSRLVLDNALTLQPPKSRDKPAYSGQQAVCEVLASYLANGGDVGRQSPDTLAAGLARVSVLPGLLSASRTNVSGYGSIDGLTSVNVTLPAPKPYADRLAWVVIVQDIEVSNCPNVSGPTTPTPIPTPKAKHHGYAVFLVDADTGGDALLYTEASVGLCSGGEGKPSVDVPATKVSVPWTLVAEAQDRAAAQIRFQVTACDGYDRVVLADIDTNPAVVRVVVQRPFGPPCSDTRQVVEKLRAARVGTTLPAWLVHAPTGPYARG